MERSPRAGLELGARAVRELVDRVHLGQDRAIVRHDAGALVLGLHLLADHPGDFLSSIRVQSEDRSPGRGRPGRHEPDAPAGDFQGAAGDLAADCHHAPEAHDGDRGCPLWRHDARRRHDGGLPAPRRLGERLSRAMVTVPGFDRPLIALTSTPVRTALEFC